MKDLGVVTESDPTLVIDKSKIYRERSRSRSNLQSTESDMSLRGLYFDGRKDDTLVEDHSVADAMSRTPYKVVKEEHISLIKMPESEYISHVTPTSGSAADICRSILLRLAELDIRLDDWDVAGCDGTNTNTEWKGGILRGFEEYLGRAVQRVICLLHFVELPLRHLFLHLDGDTSGPKTFSGPIGKLLAAPFNSPIVNFERIDCVIPDVDKADLSKDQKYLLKISNAIKYGACPPDLAATNSGPMSHSR